MSTPRTTYYHDLKVDGNIISNSFPGALHDYSTGFNNLDVAQPETLFDYKPVGGIIDTGIWQQLITNSTMTYNTTESCIDLVAGTGAGRIVNQTQWYIPYQPGKPQKYLMTGVLSAPSTTATDFISRIGSFDSSTDKTPVSTVDTGGDGHFFEYASVSSNLYVVQRKTIDSGSFQSDTKVAKSAWNIDKLDGTGPSKINKTVTQLAQSALIFFITREWLGVGDVLFGIVMDQQLIPVHKFANSIGNTTTYSKTASLPIRYEITNVGSGIARMKQICCTMMSIGGYNPRPRIFFQNRLGFTQDSAGVNTHALSIRLKPACIRYAVLPFKLTYYSQTLGSSEAVMYTISIGATPSTTLSFADYADNTNSGVQISTTTATLSSLGDVIEQGFINSGADQTYSFNKDVQRLLTSTIPGVSRVLTLSITLMAGSNVAASSVIFSWVELN